MSNPQVPNAPSAPAKSVSGGESLSWIPTARASAFVSGAFCLLLGILLVISHFQGRKYDPLNSPQIAELKASLTGVPGDEQIKAQIRSIDLQLRKNFDRRLALAGKGGWLLLGGVAVFLFTLKSATYKKKMPRPPKQIKAPGTDSRMAAQARWAVAILAVMAGATAWVLSLDSETSLSIQTAKAIPPVEVKTAEAPAPTVLDASLPTAEELRKNWPRFRGPVGSGMSAYTNAPLSWNVTTGEGVLWKTPVPISGPNSPVIWGDKIFLSGANAQKREVYCFHALSGKLLWQSTVASPPSTNKEPPTVMEDSGGFAASTVATDGRRVYAIYATGDVAAFDLSGKQVWAVSLGRPDNSYGHSTSLEFYQNRLLVQYDQGSAKEGKSRVLGLDTLTGQVAWKSEPRPVPNSWATPILINTGQKDLLITCGNPWVIAYNPTNGVEAWRAKAMYGEITPSPIFANGMVFTAIEGEKLSAIKPDGSGDVTTTHIAWSAEDGLPDISSPVSDGKYIYLVTSGGVLTCYDIQIGQKKYTHELELECKSSPGVAGDRIYIFSDKGIALVLRAGPEFQQLSRSELGEEVLSSPAFADGRLYVRGKQNLFCLGSKPK